MSETELVILVFVAAATAAITAVAGAGGGLILLVTLLQFVDPLVAIPAHAVIQFVSNSTRAVTLRHTVEVSLLRWYVVPLLPAIGVGFLIADSIPRDSGRALIGVFALLAVWWPAATAWIAPRSGGGKRFALVGVLAGVTNPPIGAAGPLIAPAFKAATKDHITFVATFAVAQVMNHLAKIVVFGIAGFAFREHAPMILVGVVGVIVGTRVGTKLLYRAEPAMLDWLFKGAVTVGAVRLVLSLM
jgi:uncharacterized membrane protein YfcA